MRQITLSVPNNQFSFFMKMVKAFDFVKVEKTKAVSDESTISIKNTRILNEIEESVKEVNLHKQGKIKMQSFDEMMVEFKEEGLIP
jgi:hypothetical protein